MRLSQCTWKLNPNLGFMCSTSPPLMAMTLDKQLTVEKMEWLSGLHLHVISNFDIQLQQWDNLTFQYAIYKTHKWCVAYFLDVVTPSTIKAGEKGLLATTVALIRPWATRLAGLKRSLVLEVLHILSWMPILLPILLTAGAQHADLRWLTDSESLNLTDYEKAVVLKSDYETICYSKYRRLVPSQMTVTSCSRVWHKPSVPMQLRRFLCIHLTRQWINIAILTCHWLGEATFILHLAIAVRWPSWSFFKTSYPFHT